MTQKVEGLLATIHTGLWVASEDCNCETMEDDDLCPYCNPLVDGRNALHELRGALPTLYAENERLRARVQELEMLSSRVVGNYDRYRQLEDEYLERERKSRRKQEKKDNGSMAIEYGDMAQTMMDELRAALSEGGGE